MKPGRSPVLEGGLTISVNSNTVNLQPVNALSRVFQSPGSILGSTLFSVTGSGGATLSYQVILRNGGLEIKPLSASAAQYLEVNRTNVLSSGILKSVQSLGADPSTLRTIYLNFQ